MKRLPVMIKDETVSRLSEIVDKCNDNFVEGHVKTQDVVEWMLATASVDVQKGRHRCLNSKKLLNASRLEFKSDVDELMKKLIIIKSLLKDKEDK